MSNPDDRKGNHTGNRADQSPEQIEAQIERTRQQLNGTAEELQQRFSPNELVDQALNYVRTNKELRRNVMTTVRENPIPLCLMGIGLLWLIGSGASGPRRHDRIGRHSGFDTTPTVGDPRFSDYSEGTHPSVTDTTLTDETGRARTASGSGAIAGTTASGASGAGATGTTGVKAATGTRGTTTPGAATSDTSDKTGTSSGASASTRSGAGAPTGPGTAVGTGLGSGTNTGTDAGSATNPGKTTGPGSARDRI